MSNFSWGILGPGGIAQAFAKDLTRLEGHRIGAVGSRSLSNAQNFASTFGGVAYGSYEELVADASIDAIYVATPHPAHRDNVILALNAGKPVLCEKPFSVNAVEAQAMNFFPPANGYGRQGIPDIICCLHGHFLAIECKAGKGTTTVLQDREIAKIVQNGGTAMVVNEHNQDELQTLLTKLEVMYG